METNEVVNNAVNNAVNTVNKANDFRNKKTAAQLMREEGAGIDFYPAKAPGRLRFECGTKAGYVCKNISNNIDNVELENIRYAEIKAIKEGLEVWMPTLFLASTKKLVKHFSL